MSLPDDGSSIQSERSGRVLHLANYASRNNGTRRGLQAMNAHKVSDCPGNFLVGSDLAAEKCIVQMKEASQDDNWGENTTCLTGNTSERSYNYDDVKRFKLISSDDTIRVLSSARCSRFASNVSAAGICFLSIASPIAMITIPKAASVLQIAPANDSVRSSTANGKSPPTYWQTSDCGPDCEGLLIGFSVKMTIMLFGIWALFVRRSGASLPRLYLSRACLLAFLFLCIFAYWLFYVVRIVLRYETDYNVIVTYALSLVDALLFVHYLVIVWVEVLHKRPSYRVHVVRSPDGESRTYILGNLSIQRAAVFLLHHYYREFPVYNPFLDRLPSRTKKSSASQVGSSVTPFKIYDVDGRSDSVNLPEVDAKAIMAAAARKRDSGHNERFYEEMEWERRVRKRKARLLTAAEEAFGHVQRIHMEKGVCAPMDACEAAQAVFPALARSLQKYIRVTKQQPRHPAESVLRHLTNCLTYDMSARAFLERFFGQFETPDNCVEYAKWSIACRPLVSQNLSHGLTFQLRCHSSGFDSAVTLLCSVTKLPFLDLTEEPLDPKADLFVLKFNSETSV
uniref:Vang-like protein n=1 Tax=Trichuris muris TaxID=70415 RepID=A0A5S6QJB5_TRIMR